MLKRRRCIVHSRNMRQERVQLEALFPSWCIGRWLWTRNTTRRLSRGSPEYKSYNCITHITHRYAIQAMTLEEVMWLNWHCSPFIIIHHWWQFWRDGRICWGHKLSNVCLSIPGSCILFIIIMYVYMYLCTYMSVYICMYACMHVCFFVSLLYIKTSRL